jgi:hypothetical protein
LVVKVIFGLLWKSQNSSVGLRFTGGESIRSFGQFPIDGPFSGLYIVGLAVTLPWKGM